MSPLRLWLVGMSAETRAVAEAAARQVFPQAEVAEVPTVEEAMQREPAAPSELLVLAEPERGAVARGVQAVDQLGRPRWAVVVLGRGGDDLAETVPPEEWNPPLVARVFRSALLQHDLGCENSRLQGDLRTMARRISHDLHTPMGCIATCAQLLKHAGAGAPSPSDALTLGNIEESLLEMTQLIERVCFLVRASADPASPTRLAMAEVVAEALDQMELPLKCAGASVVDPGSWPEVLGVPPWLVVIWCNLLANAVKHGGGQAPIRLAWAQDDDGYRFSVINQGAPIPPAIEAGLFRPFDQLHQRPAPGLGLAIVQRLVALQGGRCAYTRLADGASAFHFTLPGPAVGPGERPVPPR